MNTACHLQTGIMGMTDITITDGMVCAQVTNSSLLICNRFFYLLFI